MNDTLSRTGANAGNENCRYVLSTPDASAVSDTNTMYGNMICVMVTARPNAAPSRCRPPAIAYTIQLDPSTPITDNPASVQASTVDMASTSALVASWPWLFLNSARIGTNAWENAPSAERRRS